MSVLAAFKGTARSLIHAVPPAARLFRRWRDRRWTSVPARAEEGFLLYVPQPMLQRDREERALFAAEVRAADVCVDVGAHVGYFTCIACAAGTRTVAVEPLKDNLAVLASNIELNKFTNVDVCAVGLGARPGSAAIYGYSDIASLIPSWNTGSAARTDTIAVSTLDLLLGGRFRGQRLLIKIDVEGFERDVLAGAAETLAREPKPVWMVEIFRHFPMTGAVNDRFRDVFEVFWQAGYQSFNVGSDLRPVGPNEIDTPGVGPNFLFRAR